MTNKVYTQSVLTFDGQDDYINFGKNDIGGVFAQGSSAFTISGWVKPDQLTNQATTYGTRNVFFACASDQFSDNFEFGISEAGNLDVYIDETHQKFIKTFGNRELTVKEWHFFAIIFNQGQLTIYLDDHEYTGTFTGSALNKATSAVTLGGTLHNKIFFAGQLAHISVWNYPCSQTEIQTHRAGLIVGNESGLVAYWKLDEGEGKTVKNQTGNSYKGNLRGNPTWDLANIPFVNISPSVNQMQPPEPQTSEQQELPTTIEDIQPNEEITTELISASEISLNILPPEPPTLEQEELPTTMNTTANTKYKILAIDGGGIRGIIPAIILAEIEKRTQKPIFSLFDLIAGTSSGGILALGLTKPKLNLDEPDSPIVAEYSAEDLLQIFTEYGAEIFYEPFFEKVLGQLEDIFAQPKYSSEGREEILQKYFGDTPLEKNLKEVFVPSYDIEQRIPVFFTNKAEKQQTESRKFRKLCLSFTVTDAALATSATPTYFAPHRIPTSHNTNGFYTLVDGGLIANNPAHLAMLEAQISRQENQQTLNTEDIFLLSLGTGSLTTVYPYKEVQNWGLLQWANPLLNMVLDGGSEVVAGELERLFETGNTAATKSYYRFQTFLNGELEAIDNPRPENIRQLQAITNRLIVERSQEIDELCSLLTS
ncbi:patatin-like phospholipase family protein [Anabaena sp. 4-3]|uniref:patatin-like phospholipase family protein n=1 Tax=Anabaena sp. 4-3 TaxID=1811979 RepID=UPI00082CD614|nr:patatin-like phospholipase family protein [Anabaena sp. 4-3]